MCVDTDDDAENRIVHFKHCAQSNRIMRANIAIGGFYWPRFSILYITIYRSVVLGEHATIAWLVRSSIVGFVFIFMVTTCLLLFGNIHAFLHAKAFEQATCVKRIARNSI